MSREQVTLGDLIFRPDLFWQKVDMTGGCWTWTGCRQSKGYGRFKVRKGGKFIAIGAHRVSYALAHGGIPDGMQVDHICHNRACVNPDHLRLATARQNRENLSGPVTGNASGVRGVHRSQKGRPWRASVGVDGRKIYLGTFDTLAEAEAAVIAKRNQVFTYNILDRLVAS